MLRQRGEPFAILWWAAVLAGAHSRCASTCRNGILFPLLAGGGAAGSVRNARTPANNCWQNLNDAISFAEDAQLAVFSVPSPLPDERCWRWRLR